MPESQTMKVTVCELHDERPLFARDWERLAAHTQSERSELVVLPETPFCRWFARSKTFEFAIWMSAITAHDEWERRLHELAPAIVIASRPVDFGNERYKEGFIWSAADGCRSVHACTSLDDKAGAWEATWYHEATPEFTPAACGVLSVGFLFATELRATDEAALYGREGIHLLVSPRSTSSADTDQWLAAARRSTALAGAYGLSSNRVDDSGHFDGQGWIIAPDGEILARTDREQPFRSAVIDIARLDRSRLQSVRKPSAG